MSKKKVEEKIKLLESKDSRILKPDGSVFPVSKKGSLGLLALGYRGIIAWKKKIKA